MNVTDLRTSLRRAPVSNESSIPKGHDRRKGERRALDSEKAGQEEVQRVWLTPGERALIEDLYLLDD